MIVNCTPLGMYPNTEVCPSLPYEAMDSHTLLYDLLYNPDETLFMAKGREHGAIVKNGLEMLFYRLSQAGSFGKEKNRNKTDSSEIWSDELKPLHNKVNLITLNY